ncbi:hypothetical protein RHGRI_015400 [Rhododendron griersonianum]|uniref:Mitogen-activated protein kinase-binding protein 1 n=1 Tax=Rhododendron griersonianum TaxID=479676 RepID=A0AAV6KDR7_9ERIC|nr:hypothetical protein RHGRI_015400 [Rhododendron griersonianum]
MKRNRKLKKPDTSSKLILKEVIGLTTKNANGLASNTFSPNCVYVAGCVVVVYNVEMDTQSHFMVSNRMPKPLSCVSISKDGCFVAAGESGHQPAVLVWNCTSMALLSELKSHQYGVTCTGFSPDGKYLVSVGFSQDGYICLWDWRNGVLVTKVKACSSCSSVESVCFSSDAKFIVTAGKKHLKLWKVGISIRPRANVGVKSLVMHGKPMNIGFQKGYSFIAVTSPFLINSGLVSGDQAGENLPFYGLTDTGGLDFVNKAFALTASNKLIACACNDGVVKLFTIEFLKYSGSLQYTEAKRRGTADNKECHEKTSKKELQSLSTLPHALACQFSTSEKLVVVYGDHSLYIWDIRDVDKNLPCENMHDSSLACAARGCSGGVSFATCSADGTIRFWDLALQLVTSVNDPTLATSHKFLLTKQDKATCLVSAGVFERDSVELGNSTPGLRSMAISSDGQYLAAGDCQGNLHIYNIHTSEYICFQDTHDAEILSLSFSSSSKTNAKSGKSLESRYFLASGGRDRMIRLYDVKRNFDVIGSADDHSAAVTSVNLTSNGCKILSCSADRTLVHDVAITESDCIICDLYHQMETYGTVCDMAVDPTMEIAVTVGQDKKINALKIATGKLIRSFKQEGNLGDPVKVNVDPSCSFLVCSYSNRSICIYDLFTGEIVARAAGHGEVVTGLIFVPDCKHIISAIPGYTCPTALKVAGDGCIFVWQVPIPLSSKMLQKIKEKSMPFTPTSVVQPVSFSGIKFHEEDDHKCKIRPEEVILPECSKTLSQKHFYQRVSLPETSAFKFSISRLPRWAQAKVPSPRVMPIDSDYTSSQQAGLKVFSPLPSVGSHRGPDVQTPSTHGVKGNEPFLGSMSRYSSDNDTTGHGSRMPQETYRKSFALDRRWFTIHTVCLDLLNSPEVWDTKEMKTPVTVRNKDLAVEMTSDIEVIEVSSRDPDENNLEESAFGLSNHVDAKVASLTEQARRNNPGSASHNSDRFEIDNACACQEVAVLEVSESFQSETTENAVQATINVNASCIRSREKDPFKQNLGHSSAKIETGERKLSARRSYSGQFILRQDLLRGHENLFETPIRDFGGESMKQEKESTSRVMLGDLSVLVHEESQMIETSEQDPKNLMPQLVGSHSVLSLSDSVDSSSGYISGNLESSFEDFEKQNTIIACKEALLNLETAADNLFQLFCRLGTLENGEEITRVSEAQLYSEATEILPSIAKKVHAVAKLVQSTNNPRGETEMDVSRFEPLLGTFAESISQRVVEILKNNCSTL